MTTEKKITYDPKIITSETTIEQPLDLTKVPVLTIENCEILFSSLSTPAPKYGHNVRIMLPTDTDLNAKDRIIRNGMLKIFMKNNPNLETVNKSLTLITQKHILDGKFDEKYLNRTFIDFQVTNAYLFDKIELGEKTELKRIQKAEEALGIPVTKYFRIIDEFTGKGIEPEVFKYVNGEKVTTFINPKTKEEKPLYLGGGDIVNIKIRPYPFINKKTGAVTVKYNLLSVEVVQTAWDRGMGKKSSNKHVVEAPAGLHTSDLDTIFGGIFNTATPAPAKATTKPAVEQKPAKAETPKVEAPKAETPKQEETSEMPALDFSALANMNLDNINLGE